MATETADVFAAAAPTTYRPEMAELAADSPEAMWDLLAERGLGDGLPVVPPTPARVEAVLEHAEGDPDEVLFTLQPRSGIVTRRVVAVNAVMAGCPPETFAVVLTALRALARPEVNLRGVNATTHLVAPMIIVHGEVVQSAGFNAGVGAFGQPGERHGGSGRSPGHAARRRRPARLGRRRHLRSAGQVHVLRRREPRGHTVGELPAQPRCRRAERRHRPLR
jgi:hypothetical protein